MQIKNSEEYFWCVKPWFPRDF